MEFVTGKSTQDDEDQIPVDAHALALCWQHTRLNPTVGSCMSYISSRLLGPGFLFSSTSGSEASESFERHVRTHFVPFAKNALESIITQGYCVYGIKPRFEKSNFPVPFIFSRKAYDAYIVLERGEDKLKVKARQPSSPKMYLFVEDCPDSDGNLRCRLSSVSKTVTYLEEIESHDIHAFAIRSRPPVLTKTHTDTTFDSRDVISGSVPGLRAQDESDNMEMRNVINGQQWKQQTDMISTLNKHQIDSSDPFWKKHVNGTSDTFLSESLRNDVAGYTPRFIPLPNDADVAKFDLPIERRDLVPLQKFCKMQICTGMGVPEGYIDGQVGGGNSVAATRTMDEFVRVSLMPLRASLSRILLEIYDRCFGKSELVDCVFPGAQNVDKLFDWYESGLISYEALIRVIRFTEHIEESDFIASGAHERPPMRKMQSKRQKRENYEDEK